MEGHDSPVRVLWFFIAFAVLTLLTWGLWGGGFDSKFGFDGTVAWMQSQPLWGGLGGVGLLIADILMPVPGTVVMSALGYVYGPLLGGLFATAGTLGAGLAGYGLGRILNEKTARRFLGDADFEKGRALFTRGGGWMVALSRSLPILPEAVAVTAGLVRMPFGRFCVSLVCGCVPLGFTFAWIGSSGHDAPGLAISLSVVVPSLLWFAAKRLMK